MHQNKIRALLPALFVSAAWGQAVTPPDGGVLRQQLDPPHLPTLPGVEPRLAAPAAPAPIERSGPSVTVRTFQFSGQTLLDERTLAAAVAPWIGKTVGFAELSQAMQAVDEAYRRAGWMARADLPPQDITDGVVRVRITEARLAGTVVEGAPARRLAPQHAVAIVAAAQPASGLVDLDGLDRALLLINDLPGTSASLSLRAGAHEGDTQAVLALADAPIFSGSAGVDNEGARATGQVRANLQLAAASPLGIGDLASLQASQSEGSDYVRLAYDVPVGARGWRVGANASNLYYHIVTPDFAALGAQGPSQSAGLQATAPLVRSRNANLYLQLAADHRHFRNMSAGAVASRYDIDAATAAFNANRLDDAGTGVSSGALQLVAGRVDLGGSPNQAADLQTVHVAGSYFKLHANANRQQRIDAQTSLVVDLQGQWANRNLDGSEKFYLGGPSGVRAYPSDEAGGSRGELLSVELQRSATLAGVPLSASAFFDAGHVVVNPDNRFPGASPSNGITLKGAGAWIATGVHGVQLRLTWAHRLGDNPGANAAGRDQDGSKSFNRVWASATVSF